MDLGIPSPEIARANQVYRREERVKSACNRMRPRVVEAINRGLASISLTEALAPDTSAWGMGGRGWQETPPDTFSDVQAAAGEAMRLEVEAAGWCADIVGGLLCWCERQSEGTA